MGCKYIGCFDLPNKVEPSAKILCLDMEKAYFNFFKCSEYMGFVAKFTDFRELLVLSDKIDSLHIGLYMIKNL